MSSILERNAAAGKAALSLLHRAGAQQRRPCELLLLRLA